MSQPVTARELVALFEEGRYADAEREARRFVEAQPDSGFGWKLLGAAVGLQGRDAVAILSRAAELSPEDAEAHNNLGVALYETGRVEDAIRAYRAALKIRPKYASPYGNLGNALARAGRIAEAVPCYRRALELNPRFAEAHTGLGSVLFRLDRIAEAQRCHEMAIQIMPELAIGHANLGDTLREQGQLSAALGCYQRAIDLGQASASLHVRAGFVLHELGRTDEAIRSYMAALEIEPENVAASSNVLFTLNELATEPPAWLREAAKEYGALVTRSAPPASAVQNSADPDRPLRVGFVSGDLYNHPVGYFLESLVTTLCSQRLALAAYQARGKVDRLTERLQRVIPTWRVIVEMSDAAAAQQIREDGIDILIDLAGHTAHNRLPVFAHRPAPIQLSWLGYFATTGLSAIDYVLVDPHSVLPGEEDAFTEQIWRLPETRLCFTAPESSEPVAPLPALASGRVTFGSFGSLTKLNDPVIQAWARVLQALPDAMLFLKAKQLIDPIVRNTLPERLANHGIPADRLIIEGPSPRSEYLASYKRVDVMLDTFPYPGGTTTMEALWMGVPVVTLRGDRLLSRQGESILKNVGIPQWIAADVEDYVSLAISCGQSLDALARLRAELRDRLLVSPVMDGPRFARQFEEALRGMWKRWCDRSRTVSDN